MVEYITKEQVLEAFEKWINSREDYTEHPVWFARNISSIKSADVIERSKIDKAIAEICKINPVNENGYKNCDDIKFEVLEILKRNIGE